MKAKVKKSSRATLQRLYSLREKLNKNTITEQEEIELGNLEDHFVYSTAARRQAGIVDGAK